MRRREEEEEEEEEEEGKELVTVDVGQEIVRG